MNHEYVLFSKNTCQNSMVNVLDKDKILWYVMRAYKNENTAEDRLSNETYGLSISYPSRKSFALSRARKSFSRKYISKPNELSFEISNRRMPKDCWSIFLILV